ncbi:uncharacterized protein Dwil_GK28319 [Drosophila willistoni]|uniref:Uncharacterized protein n=1 Tax=Drosophila willistoni TaxID=7260 RepID=A0A0Q9X1G9_DROWI|nr:uncharacterized protein Dwil_GK28319 [Drosophila willistoni]
MNHTCPYDHDLIVDRVTIDFFNHQLVNVLPVPKGDHAVYSNWYAYGKKRAEINLATYKRYNGYKPTLYNFTADACKFMASKTKNPLYNYFYGFIAGYTNMNHTCPYDHDLIVEKVAIGYINHLVVDVLPIPSGDHAVYMTWYAYAGEVLRYSNFNHSCPYEGVVYVQGWYLRPEAYLRFPFPTGDYLIEIKWYLNQKLTIISKYYFAFVEDL